MKIIDKIKFYTHKNKKEILVFFLFVFVALVSVAYSFSLPFRIHGDTYVTLLANKAVLDPTYPDREILLNLDYKPYLFTNIMAFMAKNFTMFEGRIILLFLLVFVTGYGAYLAFRLLSFSVGVSVLVSLVALMPRVGISGGIFGIFTSHDVVGQAFGLPFIWLLLAWFLKRKYEQKSLWPVFVFSGLASYVHPVSLIFFNGLLFIIMIYWILKEKNYKDGIKDFSLSILAFCATAVLLLKKIFFVTKGIGLSKVTSEVFSAREYADALMYRVGWDFFPLNLLYVWHFLIINIVFIIAAVYVIWCIKHRRIVKGDLSYFISEFSLVLIFLSVFLFVFVPNTELWLVRNFDVPFVLQQTSRFFQYYYLGIFLLFSVAVTEFFKYLKTKKKLYYILILVIGLASSTFGFEVFKFVIGYHNYKQEYIPNVLQQNKLSDDRVNIPMMCDVIKKAGVAKHDLVISDDFQLRYWCELHLYSTFEEGSIYLMLGKNQLVSWSKVFDEQQKVLYGNSTEDMIVFAKKIGAKYAILESNPELLEEFKVKKMVVGENNLVAIVKFK